MEGSLSKRRASPPYHQEKDLETSQRELSLSFINSMQSYDFFSEAGPRKQLNKLIQTLEPIFARVLEKELPHIEELLFE